MLIQVTHYPAEHCQSELKKIEADPKASDRSRISVLFGNTQFPLTRTITHTQWCMFGVLPAHSVQLPHRHTSVALDFIISTPAKGIAVGVDASTQT